VDTGDASGGFQGWRSGQQGIEDFGKLECKVDVADCFLSWRGGAAGAIAEVGELRSGSGSSIHCGINQTKDVTRCAR
jgi:hypothetical protein